ncbi:MAG: glycoside hydrolase family 3 protein [Ktedonobacterales bacterium]
MPQSVIPHSATVDMTTNDNLDDWTLEELIAQRFVIGFDGAQPSEGIIDLIRRYPVGGIIFFSRNIRNARQLYVLTSQLQAIAREARARAPLLITTDQENGVVRRLGPDATIFPGAMALGASGDESLVEAVAQASGAELRALGVPLNLAPDADVNTNPANPVIGVRSFGSDPETVARLVAAAVRGYQAAGVGATIKHFPGHGDTATDSHLALPTLPFTLERLRAVELLPFKSGIAAGVEVVMLAHIALPQITPETPILPATLSRRIAQGLLRDELGFQGVIISDCLEMDAIAATIGVARGAVLAMQAGVDLILISHRVDRQVAGIEAALEAARQGALDPVELRASVARILRLKRRLLDRADKPDQSLDAALAVVGSAAHRQLSADAYARTTTLLRDEDRLLPLRLAPRQRLLALACPSELLMQASDTPYQHEALVEALQRHHPNVVGVLLAREMGEEQAGSIEQEIAAADAVLLVTLNAHLDAPQAEALHHAARIAGQSGRPVIGLFACDPYDAVSFTEAHAALATYEYTRPALAAAADVLFGVRSAVGRLAVMLG